MVATGAVEVEEAVVAAPAVEVAAERPLYPGGQAAAPVLGLGQEVIEILLHHPEQEIDPDAAALDGGGHAAPAGHSPLRRSTPGSALYRETTGFVGTNADE